MVQLVQWSLDFALGDHPHPVALIAIDLTNFLITLSMYGILYELLFASLFDGWVEMTL